MNVTLTMKVAEFQRLLLLFGSSEVKNMTPHLYLSILPFWSGKAKYCTHLEKVVKIEKKSQLWDVNSIGCWEACGRMRAVAFSPEGTRIVSGSDDKTVTIWDAATGGKIGEPLDPLSPEGP